MGERYDQQDGAPQSRPDSNETREDSKDGRTATVGERSTESEVAGQGLGQMKDADLEHRAPGNKS